MPDPASANPHFLPRNDYWGMTTVVYVSQILPGAGTVSAISTYAPINDSGQVVFWAQTNKGQVIVRADPIDSQITVDQDQASITNPPPPAEPVAQVSMTDNGVDPGVHNLFYADAAGGGTFSVTITNESQTTKMEVLINVDGPANMFLSGLSTGNAILAPQGNKVINVSETNLLSQLQNMRNDELFGVHVTISCLDMNLNPILVEQFDVVRFVAATDPNVVSNNPDTQALFLKTQTGTTMTKTIDYFLPSSVQYRFVESPNPGSMSSVFKSQARPPGLPGSAGSPNLALP